MEVDREAGAWRTSCLHFLFLSRLLVLAPRSLEQCLVLHDGCLESLSALQSNGCQRQAVSLIHSLSHGHNADMFGINNVYACMHRCACRLLRVACLRVQRRCQMSDTVVPEDILPFKSRAQRPCSFHTSNQQTLIPTQGSLRSRSHRVTI